jgi:hypothetical protein
MKGAFSIIIVLFAFLSCHNKPYKIPPVPDTLPDATILVVNVDGSNTAFFTFRYNKGDMYTFDFGDGTTLTDSLISETGYGDYQRIGHQYAKNGDYNVTLTIKNRSYTSQSQTLVEAKRIAIADFSYEILDDGRVKLKNLSENKAENYQWLIGEESFTKYGYYFFQSNKKEPIIHIDCNGKYTIKLQATNGNTGEIVKTIDIRNAKNRMKFSGYYMGQKTEINLNDSGIYYTGIFAGGSMSPYGLYQTLLKESEWKILFSKVYSFPYNAFNLPRYTLEQRYLLVKNSLEKEDKDIISITEETLNPDFYNSGDFYPKAFWVRYKVKNEDLDGELKVRIVISKIN